MSGEFEVIIAGGGIAGLTGGTISARLGRKTLILVGDMLGGHLLSIEKIEGYPGFPDGVAGYELCPSVQGQAAEAGAEFSMSALDSLERLTDGWKVTSGGQEFATRALILATGTSLKTLDVAGESRFVGKGVSHCASCDAPLLRDQAVAVVGGGDSALQEALTLAESASNVTVLVRENSLVAQTTFQDRVLAHPKIEIRYDTVVEEIVGDDVVSGVRVRRRSGESMEELEAAGVFIYVGLKPNTGYLNGHANWDLANGIPTDGEMRSDLTGVFAAGTVRSGSPGRAVSSAGEGTAAAIAAHEYLSNGMWRGAETR